MGNCLIGYHCIGPQTISDAQVAAAKKRGREVIELAKEWEEADEKEIEFPVPSFWEEAGFDMSCYVEHIAGMSGEMIDKLVDKIVDFWNKCPYWDDVSVCTLSDSTKAVFTGEMTWGDEPSGNGFDLMKAMFEHDLADALGVF